VTSRAFRRALIAATLLAVTVRAAYILIVRHDVVVDGDPSFYHFGARLLVDGYGFIEPTRAFMGVIEESASHPPLYLLWLTIPTSVGLDGPVSHMLWSTVIGAASVVVIGLIGREVAGPRAGIIAAALAAIYPNLWVYDGFLLSETTAIFTAVLTVLLAYRFLRDPTPRRAVYLGVASGVAALARAELVLLIPLLVVPLVWLMRNEDVRTRLRWMLIAVLAAAVPMAPWVVFNLTRFDRPVLLSTGLETTLLTANCDPTYYGDGLGYYSPSCLRSAEGRVRTDDDASERSDVYRRIVRDYVGDHIGRVPIVVLARWGRITGLYRPAQQVDFDDRLEGRERWVATSGLFSFYAVAVLAIAGGVILRRRRTPVYPLVVPLVIVFVAVVMALGSNRYRASAEGALVVLAAVTIDAGLRAWAARRTDVGDREEQGPHGARDMVVPAGVAPTDGD
jgi:4-amino-4-deoxy-L-arabinose transferase-like glycosyltransferase